MGHFGAKLGQIESNWVKLGQMVARGLKRAQKSAKLPPQTSSDWFQTIPRPFGATLDLSGANMVSNQFAPKFWVKFGSNLGQIGQLWGKLPLARHVSSCFQQGEFPGERARFHAEPLLKTLGICMHGCSKVSKLKKRRLRRRNFFLTHSAPRAAPRSAA